MSSASARLPTLFLSHGGGPSFFMSASEFPLSGVDKDSAAADWFRNLARSLKLESPKAIVIFSAHWESSSKEVLITHRADYPELFYDYYGFPDYTYQIKYPTQGNLELSEKIFSLLKSSKIPVKLDEKRNFDHGVFIPLKMIYPEGNIPIVQVSLLGSLDPSVHLKIGAALESLRDEGILFIGSGFATHSFGGLSEKQAENFVEALNTGLTQRTGEDRENFLVNWSRLPDARAAHPREEHLLPLHMAVGAAGKEAKAERIYHFLAKGRVFAMDCWKFD